MTDGHEQSELTRRTFLRRAGGGAAALYAGSSAFEGLLGAARATVRQGRPLIVALPTLPSGFDREVNALGPESIFANNLFETALRWAVVPAPRAGADASTQDVHRLGPGGFVSWRRDTKDPRVLYFDVRRGWKSNYGNELTAEDVKWTFERAYPLKGFSGFLFFEGGFGNPKTSSIDAVDTYTLKLTTDAPDLTTEAIMASPFNYFLDSTEAKKHATTGDPYASKWLQKNAASWGAYTVTEFTPGQLIHFKARDDYYQGKPAISEVILRQVPDSATRVALLARGDVDVAMSLAPREYAKLAKTAGVRVLNFTGNQSTFIHLNEKRPPLDNRLARQALNYAVPARQIGQAVYNGLGAPMRSPLASIYPDYTPQYGVYRYDLAKARELLKKAGHGGGFELELMVSPDAFPEHPDVASILQTAYRQIGVDLKIRTVPSTPFFNTIYGKARNYHAALDRESAFVPDPAHTMWQFFNSKSDIDTSNFDNPRYNQVTTAALKTANRAKRTALYHEAQKIVMQEAVWVFIWNPASQEALRANLHGYTWEVWDGFHWASLRRA
jgi:peptide/nickel transport system substrate-binding protein